MKSIAHKIRKYRWRLGESVISHNWTEDLWSTQGIKAVGDQKEKAKMRHIQEG